MTKRAYLTMAVGSKPIGRLELVLYHDEVPRTVRNFVGLLPRYQECSFHRIIPGFMAQGGDFQTGDGTGGGESIYGASFEDENFLRRHDRRGTLSMANSGPNTNGSQFFITFRPTAHLDGKHVVFGHVNLETSAGVLDVMEHVRTGKNDVPIVKVTIVDCGVVADEESSSATKDGDEIELDEPVKDDKEPEVKPSAVEPQPEDDEIDVPDDDEEDDGAPKTKAQALRDRLKKLKMKMNQARQLNRQEVMREGERLGSEEGMAKERKRQAVHDKKLREKEWEARNSQALQVAAEAGVDGKAILEPASDSVSKAMRKADKAVASRYSVKDYYNPEGQHRNYERNLNSLPSHAALERSSADSSSTFNPMMATVSTSGADEAEERKGARRLANEMKRRIEKQAKKRERPEFEGTDVSYINQRNKRFNQKISRNYDEHTAEIRQNLERGTAL